MKCPNLVLAFCVMVAIPAEAQIQVTPGGSESTATSPDARILFTGYLLGYYRIPEYQTSDFQPDCKQDETDTTKKDHPFDELIAKIESQKRTNPAAILVGMGDDFAVELGSRTWIENQTKINPKTRDPQSRPGWSNKVTPGQIGDNVGCFLSAAGYDAIVPGKEDFYFGAQRLRMIAERLAAVPENFTPANSRAGGVVLNPVHMLAANLVIRTVYWQKPKAIPDSLKKLAFRPSLPKKYQSQDINDGTTVLPFLQRIRIKETVINLTGHETVDYDAPYICQATSLYDPDSLFPDRCHQDSDLMISISNSGEPAPYYQFSKALSVRNNYGLCVDVKRKAGTTAAQISRGKAEGEPDPGSYCLRFSVGDPFFSSDFNIIRGCGIEEHNPPYFCKEIGNTRIVVYGVVDPDLQTLVGRDNLSWENLEDAKKYNTRVIGLDPVVSLKQAMQVYDKNHPKKNGQRVLKVLLAQMSRPKADELATHLDFDIVIASPDDFEHATSNQEVKLDPEPIETSQATGKSFRTFVVTPWQAYDHITSKPVNPLRELDMIEPISTPVNRSIQLCDDSTATSLDAQTAGKRVIKLCGEFQSMKFKEPRLETELKKEYGRVAAGFLNWNGKSTNALLQDPSDYELDEELFRMATLKIMRDKTDTDVAFIQKRDFYWGPFEQRADTDPTYTNPNGEDIERILWKGDYLAVLVMRGATLKKVLEASKKFDEIDRQTTLKSEETNRALVTFGVEKTEDGNYLVNGVQLDPDRLYTAATTNHIMAGDTGYPDLADANLADLRLPGAPNTGEAQDRRISEDVCKALGIQGCVEGLGLIFAKKEDSPDEPSPRLSQRMTAWSRSSFKGPLLSQRDPEQSPARRVSERPTWRVSLKESSVNLSATRNNLSEVQRVTQLTGVSEPGAYAAKGHSLDFATRAEWVRTGTSIDEYLRGQLEYKVTATGNTTTAGSAVVPILPAVSRTKNRFVIDAGIYLHAIWPHKYYPKLGFVVEPFRFDTPLVEDVLQIQPHFTNGVQDRPGFNVPLERTRKYLSRLGLRAENAKSYFEIGYQAGVESNALKALTTNVGPCELHAGQSLTSCLAGLPLQIQPSSLNETRVTRTRNGPYVDANWSLPLFHGISFVTQDQGEFYSPAGGDNSTDTLYRNDWTTTVPIPVFSNISVQPGFELFEYENKIGHTHLQTFSPVIKISFSFDRYSGGKWGKALRYKPGGAADSTH